MNYENAGLRGQTEAGDVGMSLDCWDIGPSKEKYDGWTAHCGVASMLMILQG